MNRFVSFAAIVLVGLSVASVAYADILDGQTVATTFTLSFPHGGGSFILDSANSIVGPGTALTNFGGYYLTSPQAVDIDFSDSNIVITSRSNGFGPSVYLQFEDVTSQIPRFTSVTLNPATTWAGFDSSKFDFDANSIWISLARFPDFTTVQVGEQISLDLTAMAPEPASAMLLLGGVVLFSLAFGLRFKQLHQLNSREHKFGGGA